MAYCSITEVRNKNPLLLTELKVSTFKIEKAIIHAESIINGLVGQKYDVPFTAPFPAILPGLSADLAAAHLLKSIIGNRGENGVPTQARDLYSEAIVLLEKIANGEMSLECQTLGQEPIKSPTFKSTTYNKTHKFKNWNPFDASTYQEF